MPSLNYEITSTISKESSDRWKTTPPTAERRSRGGVPCPREVGVKGGSPAKDVSITPHFVNPAIKSLSASASPEPSDMCLDILLENLNQRYLKKGAIYSTSNILVLVIQLLQIAMIILLENQQNCHFVLELRCPQSTWRIEITKFCRRGVSQQIFQERRSRGFWCWSEPE